MHRCWPPSGNWVAKSRHAELNMQARPRKARTSDGHLRRRGVGGNLRRGIGDELFFYSLTTLESGGDL